MKNYLQLESKVCIAEYHDCGLWNLCFSQYSAQITKSSR